MNVKADIQSESFAATYQTLEMGRLNDTLKESGVTDSATRRIICEKFFFSSGYFLDSCCFNEGDKRIAPVIAFAELSSSGAVETLWLPDANTGTMYHEYSGGAAEWLFDQHGESTESIHVGEKYDG